MPRDLQGISYNRNEKLEKKSNNPTNLGPKGTVGTPKVLGMWRATFKNKFPMPQGNR